MLNYFFNYTQARERDLRAKEVPFEFLSLGGARGFTVEANDLNKALVALHSEIEINEDSGYEGIRFLQLKRVPVSETPRPFTPTPRVTVQTWRDTMYQNECESKAHREKILRILEDFFPQLGVEQVLIYADQDGRNSKGPKRTANAFHILLWSSATGESHDKPRNNERPTQLWGIPIHEWRVWWPSGEGVVVEDDNGTPIGELIGNNLYTFYPLQNSNFPRAAEIFRKTLEEAIFLRNSTEADRAARFRQRHQVHLKETRAQYIKTCSGRFEKTLEGTRKAVRDGRQRITAFQKELVTAIREMQGSERKLMQLENSKPDFEKLYGGEFDKLASLPKVLGVKHDVSKITVFTDTLYCVDSRSRKTHEIGAFKIELYFEGQVRWFNQTRLVQGVEHGMHAPHIYNDGHACLGTIAEIVPELIANYEFAALAMVAISFVESANVDDPAGAKICLWPEAQKQGKESNEKAAA